MSKSRIKLSSLTIDSDPESSWVDVTSHPSIEGDIVGLRFKVRPLNHKPYSTGAAAFLQKLSVEYGSTLVPDEISSVGLGKLFVEHILTDWEGMEFDYSSEAALLYMTDQKYRVIQDMLYNAAASLTKKKLEYLDTETKN
jgi:hypothetical protein